MTTTLRGWELNVQWLGWRYPFTYGHEHGWRGLCFRMSFYERSTRGRCFIVWPLGVAVWRQKPNDVIRCVNCSAEGYGAGPCAACHQIVCYDCARDESRDRTDDGAWWFCPACSDAKAPPRPFDPVVVR
jgi:hypothetical protein